MELAETRNGTGDSEDDYTNIYFIVGDRREIASFRPDRVTDKELKELFGSAAEAGPLDIVKLRKGDKLVNISPQLPANTPDTPYVLQVVGAHPASSGMKEAELLRALERRVAILECQLREHREAASSEPSMALGDLKRRMDSFKKKLETTEHLSWLGFHKQLPEPVSSEACRRLQYRRKSDSVKRRVREKFLDICDVAVSQSVRERLRSPAFDAREWEDEELLLMLQTMFVELDLLQKFDVPMSTLRNFLYEVYKNYNEVPFHNFRHCFCVAQMMYAITWAVDLPTKIGHLEVFVLIVSSICHDLDHPGYNNIYQINARTELALRYNDISPLENHHCSVSFRVLEAPECNILASLDAATFRTVREGIIRCILATDMARHNEILSQFTDTVPEFDYQNKTHINLLSMILIKVADISNEARPLDVAEPWLDRLLQEFFKQSDAEKLEGLPVTPFMDRDKVTKPSSQCSFIGLVLLPLFEVLGELVPELQELIVQPARFALDYYRRLNEAAKDERHHRKSIVDLGESATSTSVGSSAVTKSTSSHSMRSKRSGGTIRSRSRSTDEDAENPTIEEVDNLESSDPETATEVEISEKTLKFKISTEGSVAAASGTGRKSYPGSRKGSREKSSLEYHNHDLAKAVREHERQRRRSRGENPSSDMSSPVSARSGDEPRILEEFLERSEIALVETRVGEGRAAVAEGNGNVVASVNDGRNRSKRAGGTTYGAERAPAVTAAVAVVVVDDGIDDNDEEDDDDDDDADVRVGRKESVLSNETILRCCCDEKTTPNNHKSLLSRLRNFTDRLSISFDSKDATIAKPAKLNATSRSFTKSDSVSSPSASSPKQSGSLALCKRCNIAKRRKESKESKELTTTTVMEIANMDKRAMTLPKAKKSQDGKNKSWRTVFAKEKRPSASLETLPGHDVDAAAAKHRRNLSNPEGKISVTKSPNPKEAKDEKRVNLNDFKEIDVRTKPEIIVHPGSSNIVDNDDSDDIGKVEIRRSSASMEDISKITKQNEGALLGSLEEKKPDEFQHTGSLDSMLYKESTKTVKKPFGFPSPCGTKKSSPGLFSRFKSGMSIDGTRSSSNSGSLHDQTPQQQQQQQQQQQHQSGWISSLTASFRPKRQAGDLQTTPRVLHSPGHEGVK